MNGSRTAGARRQLSRGIPRWREAWAVRDDSLDPRDKSACGVLPEAGTNRANRGQESTTARYWQEAQADRTVPMHPVLVDGIESCQARQSASTPGRPAQGPTVAEHVSLRREGVSWFRSARAVARASPPAV
jgi:hypothetical protein